MLSDRSRKWLRKRFEKLAGSFYSGPRPPEERLRQQAIDFANMYRFATREQWVSFAAAMAEEVWRSAYLAGVEWTEREEMDLRPEAVMDQVDPFWRSSPAFELVDPDAVVSDVVPEGAREQMESARFEALLKAWRKGR